METGDHEDTIEADANCDSGNGSLPTDGAFSGSCRDWKSDTAEMLLVSAAGPKCRSQSKPGYTRFRG